MKSSGCAGRLPQLLLIFLVATLLAAGVFLAVPFLRGRPAYPPGTFPVLIEGNEILVDMDPNKEVVLAPLGGLPLSGTGGQSVLPVVTATTQILPTQSLVTTTAAPIPSTPVPPTLTPRPQAGCVIFTNYTVSAGDTLFSISHKFVTSIALMARHGISSTSLVPGAVLRVPVGDPSCCSGGWRPYVVEEGETWFSIAQQCGTTVSALQQGNGVGATATLYMTSVICVP